MKLTTGIIAASAWLTLHSASIADATSNISPLRRRGLGDRFDNLEETYDCIQRDDGHTNEVWEDVDISYYYAVETSGTPTMEILNVFSEYSFDYVNAKAQWCFRPNTDAEIDDGSSRALRGKGYRDGAELATESARRLEVLRLYSSIERYINSVPCNFEPSSEDVTDCKVVKGTIQIVADPKIDNRAFIASILDAVQDFIEDDLALEALSPLDSGVLNVKWLGETFEEAVNGGPIIVVETPPPTEDSGDSVVIIVVPPTGGGDGGDAGGGGGGDGNGGDAGDGDGDGGGLDIDTDTDTDNSDRGFGDDGNGTVPVGVNRSGDSSNDENDIGLAFAVSIPLVILAILALFLAKRRTRTIVVGRRLDEGEDYIITGTGDPPQSFHEGTHHFTKSGVSYLSTNCAHCHTTRQSGFLPSPTNGDLDTINEGSLFDPSSPRTSGQYDGVLMSESMVSAESMESGETCEVSQAVGKSMVAPSTKSLGNRHSSMDVHSCTSVMCKICKNGANRNVAFVSSPTSADAASLIDAYSPPSSPRRREPAARTDAPQT